LDVGTGTGIVLHAIAPLVNEIIGLDISQAMLEHSNWQDNKYFVRRDIRDAFFNESIFDRVVARMVFHHIITGTQDAANECYRILKPGGKFILSEGIPPCLEVKQEYIEIFKLKEERLTFMTEDLVNLLQNAGFKNIQVSTFVMSRMSVNNWLEKSGLPAKTQDKIFEMHICAPDYFKKAYNMKIIRGDCLIDIKYVILVGEK
jgi:ubiquinone/menaquinone biosynthesis C-methylase UbiE